VNEGCTEGALLSVGENVDVGLWLGAKSSQVKTTDCCRMLVVVLLLLSFSSSSLSAEVLVLARSWQLLLLLLVFHLETAWEIDCASKLFVLLAVLERQSGSESITYKIDSDHI